MLKQKKLSFMMFDVYAWLNDTRTLSAEAKGAWIDTLAYMWNAPKRGVWKGTNEEFSRATGTAMERVEKIIDELTKVANVTKSDNEVTLENRRMIKQEKAYKNHAKRQKLYRERQKSDASGTNKTLDVKDVRCEMLDKDKKNNTLAQAPKRVLFSKPSAEEITAYAKGIGFDLNGRRFWDFYESNGWRVGKNPMKNWQAAVRTWRQNDFGGGNNASNGGASSADGSAFIARVREAKGLRKAEFSGSSGQILSGIRDMQTHEKQASQSNGDDDIEVGSDMAGV